ncbi:serine/threonine-protein kinase [Chamaesiphon sp. VAR_48_metabat_403]|uniref:serine/threonine-protein kinase n=1 Tax=Chamaesiphon sp. VAR_48_metabat_403 TaxID=2964700 RepID=UPI00286E69F0|nr:serine/threonine-protein kinase [Chamaesiphon sp. VAR_48_metabat_403]
MNDLNSDRLDLSHPGYQIDRVLGQNVNGGRVTYLATDLEVDRSVVIKQFQFATIGNRWSDYDSYQREVEILQQLKHPNIPKYLTSWETPNGFCLAQEYKSGRTLADSGREFDLEAVKQIAIDILEILIYLQQQVLPIIHRDIKPENILIDDRNCVYLIDFGFARNTHTEQNASSTIKGTLGFMPPEQLFNRPLTKAADLYGLGVTLVCLLTGQKSLEISQLIDTNYRLDLRSHLGHLPPRFLDWLIKMTEPRPEHRYPDAFTALTALQSLNSAPNSQPLTRIPEILLGILLTLGMFSYYNHLRTISKPSTATITIEQLHTNRGCPGCNLTGIDLQRLNLQSYDFSGANFTGADLRNVDLRGASLRGANLTNVLTFNANFASADFTGATISDALARQINRR